MRIEHGHWVCTWCGATVDFPLDKPYRVEIQATSGRRNVRVVYVDRKEVHRCTDDPPPQSGERRTVAPFAPIRRATRRPQRAR
jgi:hypothetical protein